MRGRGAEGGAMVWGAEPLAGALCEGRKRGLKGGGGAIGWVRMEGRA